MFSFVSLVILGTLGFKLLPGLYQGDALSWTDALFTATSAICVTGLIVVDTETFFTFWGQAYLLLLIQLGGVGFLTFASLILTALGGRPSLRAEQAVAGSHNVIAKVSTQRMILDILRFTLVCELIGAAMLVMLWGPTMGWRQSLWPAVFHAVSAFCNAGFSTNQSSLMQYSHSSATLLTLSVLIVIGGIGFVVLEEITNWSFNGNKKFQRLSLHSKLVLVSTTVLIVLPVFAFALFEWNRTLAGHDWGDKWVNSLFMSITPRTAGFNTIDYGHASDSTNFLTILLMSIGGSPGSTAGGMKTTVFTLLVLLAWSRVRGKHGIIAFDRSIPEKTIQQAMGLFVVMFSLTVVGVLVLQIADDPLSEDHQLFVRIFEVTSAVNTVGLSMGITANLSIAAKWSLVLLMFIGRVGPLALAAAVDSRLAERQDFRLAQEDIIIG